MTIVTTLSDKAIIQTQPIPEFACADVDGVVLVVYDLEEMYNFTTTMSEAKGRELVEKLTKQLDKIPEIAKHRAESQKKMLDSMEALQRDRKK